MSGLFHVTIRSEHDEVIEFESSQPVLHIDMPAGRFVITVRCAKEARENEPTQKGAMH